MGLYRKKPIVIEAEQWFPGSDIPEVGPSSSKDGHGWIDTLEGGHIVSPGDWIITGVVGEKYPCKPGVFAATYEEVKASDETVPVNTLNLKGNVESDV